MAVALMQSVLLTGSVEVLPHPTFWVQQHSKHWVRLQQGGDAAVSATGEHLEGAENVVQPRDVKLEVGRSHTKVVGGFYSTEMVNSLCFS